MASPNTPQGTANLEDDLRNMILSNVQIAPATTGHANRGNSMRGRGQSRGRGAHGQHHTPHNNTNNNSMGGRQNQRGQPWQNNQWRSPRPQQPRQHQNQQLQANQAPPMPGQGETPAGAPTAAQAAAPRVLQRPQSQQAPTGPAVAPRPFQHRQNRFPHNNTQMNRPVENPILQVEFLDFVASREIPLVEMSPLELEEKEAFRRQLEGILQQAVAEGDYGDLATIELVPFGSIASGFATPGSDMDLAIVPIWKDQAIGEDREMPQAIPRLLEKAVLDSKLGGRLLTRTRVPILKICQQPTEALYTALCEERKKWEELPEEERIMHDTRCPQPAPKPKPSEDTEEEKQTTPEDDQSSPPVVPENNTVELTDAETSTTKAPTSPTPQSSTAEQPTTTAKDDKPHPPNPRTKAWLREKVLGPLDFPKSGVGIQSDINFSNLLGIHNTALLRCYSLCDPRVRPMVLFIKSWAKRRKINSAYSGTLSSYGWVLMVLHFLVNVAEPPVCPNLQLAWRPPPNMNMQDLERMYKVTKVDGYAVRFWRDAAEISHAAQSGQLTRNRESVGALLRGFFKYYAALNTYGGYPRRNFFWTSEVLSLRTQGGILTKQEKGWTGAKTTMTETGKEVRHRYLFAIEDPFELDHNVARTVTHNGIVAIRDELRRAWRIISAVGKGMRPEGELFDEVVVAIPPPVASKEEKEVVAETAEAETKAEEKIQGKAGDGVAGALTPMEAVVDVQQKSINA